VTVWTETFAIMKSKRLYPHAFVNIIDKTEITVIFEETHVCEEDIIDIEYNWKLFTFNMQLPLDLVGFLATVARALADKHIPIIVISAYSTDHILVKHDDITEAKATLETLVLIVNA
jgi:hypothetical protein